ncbi:KpsF/GutQ family sugar-phosphate isomerase [Cytobacillus horneckiae]|uniref:KpsF/GutQ family sugar-phosphate isomerase n=1 Tax=Cytobacillus horneckiae TaxID=549687 RepID=A0A2N0ZFD9_9BACI|nr:KpsF/GutQ family sugar-phosphate isomerase [Cytobacillus horneckiae]MBN6885234.1 KpsF/GutQ family sugar-phosphate isomerase [Cytobacillus horneckiae]MCM3179021.1 KpsF/GutQ family sugar-phosphate isomerase [Cytobacillus horneckiae]MEC1154238.1 KpsF/GutQ family sugar-phosphate isomerase [Cytobacillus horneckiae]MED2937574.1 KpsF/GutQ family sugar-phosphate isomerase [Cytobacillus horneckiae]PKG28225.1 KpsF/GutQ family sugar-phosphate isomerase [Cytobacillus horneckiae]
MLLNTKTYSQDYTNNVIAVLEKEAQAILDLKGAIGHAVNDAIQMILECHGRVVITGIGKSGIIGRKINATMASTGTPSFFLHPSEGLHGDLGMVTANDVIIAISNSGESEEVLNLIPSIKKIGAKMIAIVKNPLSTLAIKSDIVLCIGNAEEACPLGLAPTTSTTVTLALGDAVAIALLQARNFQPEDFAVFHPAGSLGRRLLLKAADVTQTTRKNPIVLHSDSVKEALFLMTTQGMGAISVVDERQRLVGVLTDGDIRRAFAMSVDMLSYAVDELCNKQPVCIQAEELAAEAMGLMEKHKINVLPVINSENQPIGMLHIHDLMNLGL